MYKTITINGNEYKCVLTAKDCVNLERHLGMNPVAIFAEVPKLDGLLTVLQYSLRKFQHEYTFDEVCDLYDEMLEDGMGFKDLNSLVLDILKGSGFIQKRDDQKNA